MRKKLLTGTGIVALMAAAFLVGTLTIGSVFAQGTHGQANDRATVESQDEDASEVEAQGPDLDAVEEQVGDQNEADDQQSDYVGSIQVAQDQSEQSDEAEQQALAGLAKITPDQAKAAALAQFPGANITKVELDNENGSLVYSVELTANSGAHDVKVDAGNGKVLQVETGDADNSEQSDGQEADED